MLVSGLLLAATVGLVAGVGRHPTDAAPLTSFRAIGELDGSVYEALVRIRTTVLTNIFEVFDWSGKGVVTIPIRIVLVAVLLWRRFFGAAIAFAISWAVSEIAIEVLKTTFMRGRPPLPLVETVGFSFPSGHATAGAAIAVSIVLAFMRHGLRRRLWVAAAMAFAFVMAFSRVYLGAHWLSDVTTGVLLGTSTAALAFAGVDSIRHASHRRRVRPTAALEPSARE